MLDIGFQAWLWIAVATAALLMAFVFLLRSRPKEEVESAIHVLTVRSVQTIWVTPIPPKPLTPPAVNTYG